FATGAKDGLPFEVAPPKTIITIQVSGSEIKSDPQTNQIPPSDGKGGNSSDNTSLGGAPSRYRVSNTPAMIWDAETREWVISPENEGEANGAVQEGLRLLESGKPDEANRFFDRAIQLNPKYADAYYNRSLAYYNLGKFEASLEDSNTAL